MTDQTTDKPFMYAIQSPDGSVYMGETCVCEDPGPLNDEVTCLNDDHEGDGEYKVVPVYLGQQAVESERGKALDEFAAYANKHYNPVTAACVINDINALKSQQADKDKPCQ
jgi:hypothetical protein